jgi:hypothetical protein
MRIAILLLFVTVFSLRVAAQSNNVHYGDLSGKEKSWAMFHPRAAKKVKKIIPEVRTDVRQKIADKKIDSLIHGGQADAYRHALWMALTAKHIGDKKARRVGQMHEESNKLHFYKSEKEDNALQDSISCQMDLLNNDLGIAYGIGYKDKSDDELKELVLNGILAGEFFMLFRNSKNEFIDCEGNVVDNKNRLEEKKWYLPYCLVPTNNTSEVPTH